MNIKTYKKGDRVKLSDNFKSSEFACKGDGCCSTVMIDMDLVDILQKIRDGFNLPLTINSGYRCETHNAKVGGAKSSYHMTGRAADIRISSVAPLEVAKYAEALGVKGIGLYENFVHIDTRSSKYYWIDGKGQVDTFHTEDEHIYSLDDFVKEIKALLTKYGY